MTVFLNCTPRPEITCGDQAIICENLFTNPYQFDIILILEQHDIGLRNELSKLHLLNPIV